VLAQMFESRRGELGRAAIQEGERLKIEVEFVRNTSRKTRAADEDVKAERIPRATRRREKVKR